MIKKLDFKKELTEHEFKNIINICSKNFESSQDIHKVILGCESKTKEITPAKEAYILLPDTESNQFTILSLDQTIPLNIGKNSIISECYNTKQALIVNDITQSFLYDKAHDNFLDMNIKDLMVMPVLDEQNEQTVIAIIWAAISLGSLNQYTQRDLDYMSRFSTFIKKFIQSNGQITEHTSREADMDDCLEAYDKLSARIRREQEYFSNIIHDIRTPMNGVIGFLELLKLNESNAQKYEYIKTALNSAQDMVSLINDALDISKMASGKMGIEKTEFSPFQELGDIAKLFFNSAKKKGITLDAYYAPNIPETIKSDYHRIKQIINNLLNNAIKFTPINGTIFLELLYNEKIDGLTVSVKDTGIGIAKEKQSLIFTPYGQEKTSTAREFGGTGLGLSISQQLSVLLGGKMELESEEGKGSRFHFTIPCNTPPNTPSMVNSHKLQNINALIYDSKNRNSSIDIIERYLKDFGISFALSDKDEPLSAIRNKNFDLLIIHEKDSLTHEEEIQLMLDQSKAIIILEEIKLEEEHCWYAGKIKRITAPIISDAFYKTMSKVIFNDIEEKNTKETFDPEKLKDKKILIVDDNEINLKVMREILKTYNIKTLTANNGEEGIEKYKNKIPNMIFMDQKMPGMQGDEAVEQIRKTENEMNLTPSVIIGLTGNSDKETKDTFLSVGANDVLTKPIQVDKLKALILHYLNT